MEIITQEKESFHLLKLILLKSFIMFGCSVLCGWIIYNFFPNWIEVDFLIPLKTSVLGMLLLGWIIFYPKFICSKIWGLVFISFLGGIFFSLFFATWGSKFCIIGCTIICAEFICGIILGKIFQNKINRYVFLIIASIIVLGSFLMYAFWVFKYRTYIIFQPLYWALALLVFVHLVYVCSKAQDIMDSIINSTEKHPQNKFAILFYLNLLALGNFVETSRIIVLLYYQIIQVFSFQKK